MEGTGFLILNLGIAFTEALPNSFLFFICLLIYLQQLLTEAELRLKEFSESVEELKKDSTNILKRTGFGEEHLQRGSTNLR